MSSVLLQVQQVEYVAEQLLNLELETKKQTILQDVTFSLAQHEFVGLVGPNGSGKTTLSKLLARIIEPTAGTILLQNQEYQQIKPEWHLHQQVSLVFQNVDTQFIGVNFLEDMLLYLGNFGWNPAQIKTRVTELATQLDLTQLIQRPFKEMSGGQKQLLAIAEALAVQPQLLILDEPTAQLDPENTQLVLQLLQKLRQQTSTTILLITHKLAELALTQRVLVLNQGRITHDRPTQELLADESLLRANQLPIPDTLTISCYLQELTQQDWSLPQTDLTSFIELVKEHLC